jgi:hypothetical protein
MDEDQVTLLTVLDYCNIIRNMLLHDTRRTNQEEWRTMTLVIGWNHHIPHLYGVDMINILHPGHLIPNVRGRLP